MSNATAIPTLVWLARSIVGATLLLSGLSKLRDVDAFVSGALAYRVLDGRIVAEWAWLVPWVEVALGTALLAGWATRVSAAVAIGLLMAVAGAVVVNVWRGRKIACHCFGAVGHDVVGVGTLIRLVVMVTLVTVVAFAGSGLGHNFGHLRRSSGTSVRA